MPYLKFPKYYTAKQKQEWQPPTDLQRGFTIVAANNDINGNSRRMVLMYGQSGSTQRVIKTTAMSTIRHYLENRGYIQLGRELFLQASEYNNISKHHYVENEDLVMLANDIPNIAE
jgi:hypothetical protein